MLFSPLIIAYLFLGGVGAGFLVFLSLLELIQVRRSFRRPVNGSVRRRRFLGLLLGGASAEYPKELFMRCWPFCLSILGFAVVCLLFDLGRIDRALSLFTNPTLSALSVGSYGLLLAIGCAAAFSFIRVLKLSHTPRRPVLILSVSGIIFGLVTAVYTGMLLRRLVAVLFWTSPFLPLLFLLSSLSTGVACVLLGASFVDSRRSLVRMMRNLTRIDAVLIVLETIILGAYLAFTFADPNTTSTALALLVGDMSWVFWVGLVGCGMALPFILEMRITAGNYSTQVIWIALLVLVGGLILRFCIVEAASYDITQSASLIYHTLDR